MPCIVSFVLAGIGNLFLARSSVCCGCLLSLQNQLVQCVVDGVFTGLADPFVPDHSFAIDDEKRWRGGHIPLSVEVSLVIERTPVDVVLDHRFFEFARIVDPGIDADRRERLIFQFRYERPLVCPGGPSGESEFAPEIEQHHLSTIVAEFEWRTVLVFANDVWSDLADAQISDGVEF